MRKPTGVAMLAMIGALALLAACGKGESGGSQAPSAVRVGDRAPGFALPSGQGGRVSLAEFRGRKPVLLFFSMGPG